MPNCPGATEHGDNNWCVYIANTDEDLPEIARGDASPFLAPE